MQTDEAISALSALSHPKRLEAFRIIVAAGSDGVSSGALADRLSLLASTMSANLSSLARADLVYSVRRGKEVYYYADLQAARGLIQFLFQDCCEGRPEVCGPWIDQEPDPTPSQPHSNPCGSQNRSAD